VYFVITNYMLLNVSCCCVLDATSGKLSLAIHPSVEAGRTVRIDATSCEALTFAANLRIMTVF